MQKRIIHQRPDYVNNFIKPPQTEIKYINGHWYLYEIIYINDGHSHKKKKSGRIIGSITENGLKESRIRLNENSKLLKGNFTSNQDVSENLDAIDIIENSDNTDKVEKNSTFDQNNKQENGYAVNKNNISHDRSNTVEIGATLYFYQRTVGLRERLKKYFPDIWEKIYVIHLLRLIYEPKFKRLKLYYQCSILSEIFPYIDLSHPGIRAILLEIGRRRSAIHEFMKEDLSKENTYLLVDGHRLITESKKRILPDIGYDSKKRYKTQINLLYIFLIENYCGKPAYYKQFCGNTPDVTAFEDFLKVCDLEANNIIAVTDKGFISDTDFDLLVESGFQYIIPLRRNNKFIKDNIPSTLYDYDSGFIYHKRPIIFKEIDVEDDFRIFLFCDVSLFVGEFSAALIDMEKKNNTREVIIEKEEKRRLKNKGKLTDEELAELVPISLSKALADKEKIGTITLKSNCHDLNGEQIFLIWKTRQAIEQYFKTYDVTLNFSDSFMQDDISEEARLFLNHISGMTAMSCINEIYDLDLSKQVSLNDIRFTFSRIQADFIDGLWQIKPMTTEILKLCKKLSIDFSDLSMINELLKNSKISEYRKNLKN